MKRFTLQEFDSIFIYQLKNDNIHIFLSLFPLGTHLGI